MLTEEERKARQAASKRRWVENNREHLRAYDRMRRQRDLDNRRKQDRERYEKSSEARKTYARASYQERREWLNDVEHFIGCFICGEDQAHRLEWHHLTPVGGRGRRVTELLAKHGYAAAMEEMKRCVLLCANCHLDVHHWDNLWPDTRL